MPIVLAECFNAIEVSLQSSNITLQISVSTKNTDKLLIYPTLVLEIKHLRKAIPCRRRGEKTDEEANKNGCRLSRIIRFYPELRNILMERKNVKKRSFEFGYRAERVVERSSLKCFQALEGPRSLPNSNQVSGLKFFSSTYIEVYHTLFSGLF